MDMAGKHLTPVWEGKTSGLAQGTSSAEGSPVKYAPQT